MGANTIKINKGFKNYRLSVAVTKYKTVFGAVKNNGIEKIPNLQRSGVYKFECYHISVGEMGRKFECR